MYGPDEKDWMKFEHNSNHISGSVGLFRFLVAFFHSVASVDWWPASICLHVIYTCCNYQLQEGFSHKSYALELVPSVVFFANILNEFRRDVVCVRRNSGPYRTPKFIYTFLLTKKSIFPIHMYVVCIYRLRIQFEFHIFCSFKYISHMFCYRSTIFRAVCWSYILVLQ